MKDNKLFSIIPYKNKLIELYNAQSAKAYYRDFFIDLLSGERGDYDFFEWTENLKNIKLNDNFETIRQIHLFYELGFLITKDESLLDAELLLAVDIEFKNYKDFMPDQHASIVLELKQSPDLQIYQAAFLKGYEELLKGNCYQFNLTYPFIYNFKPNYHPRTFISALWKNRFKRGAFGSATYIPFFHKLYLSNSPECLFQLKDNKLSSMPIKGTMQRNANVTLKEQWHILRKDQKSQAELFMIADLLRNDLSSIETPCATIVKKKAPKLVPGLIHQYSQIDVELSHKVTLWKIIEKIFPGGSITGAPKIRAIRLINQLEQGPREFYCGSTILLHKQMKSASINIRSANIDIKKGEFKYQAGGGITLLSKVEEEFKEMTYKHDSFIKSITL